MLFIYLFLSKEVDFHINIIHNIAGILIIALSLLEYSFFIRDMELIDQDLDYLLCVFLEVYYQLSFLLTRYDVVYPVPSTCHDLRSDLLPSIHRDSTEAFVQECLAW